VDTGEATVTATSEGRSGSATVLVRPPAVATVTVSPAFSALAVGATVQLSATLRDSSGAILTGRPVLWTSSSPAIASVSNAGLVTAVAIGVDTVTAATDEGTAGSAVVVVQAPNQCGTTVNGANLTGLSREVGSAAGGATVVLRGTNFLATDCVYFGSAAATITAVSSTELRVVVPPGTPGPVDVSVRQSDQTTTLGSAFTYEPAPTRVYFSVDFEDSTFGGLRRGLSTGSQAIVSNAAARTGTRSAYLESGPGSPSSAALNSPFADVKNPPVSAPNGLYQRWFIRVPQATIDSTYRGQMKLHLTRVGGTQPPNGWLMTGTGRQFSSDFPGAITAFGDATIFLVPGSETQVGLVADQWMEIQTWYQRRNGTGHVKLWLDGRLMIDAADSRLGTDDPNVEYRMYVGIVYTQATSGSHVMFIDDVAAADGFIDP
jgi:hypothetical protein